MFFFKQKTAYEMRISDWSSDVCSSDLVAVQQAQQGAAREFAGLVARQGRDTAQAARQEHRIDAAAQRAQDVRLGKRRRDGQRGDAPDADLVAVQLEHHPVLDPWKDRKSTRLNSSH